ncbi:MAG TPA: formin [Byssovorax sp.]|jgi:hypothetical protein
MADEKKKTKINLKDRLGRGGGAGAGGGVVPAPMPSGPGAGAFVPPPMGDDGNRVSGTPDSGPDEARGSAPAPAPAAIPAPPKALGIAPPPGMSPGIPLPPFGRPAPQAAAPKATAQAQTIKVEVGEEVVAERSKASRRAALYAIIAAAVAVPVGFVIGGAKDRGDRAKAAQEGAGLLSKDVKAADDKLKELTDKITDGAKQLGEKKFPTDLVTALGSINIPFDASNLENRQVGSLPAKVLRPLLNFTSAAQDVNKQKDALKNILTAAEKPITKAWKEEKDPPANFAILFGRNGDKTYGELVPIKEPFPFGGKDWPGNITVTKYENRKPAEKKATRWVKGDLTGSDPIVVPAEPGSVAQFSNDALVGRLSKALFELRETLEGKKDDPTHETAGLVKDGDDLANELHKVAISR